MLARPLAGSKHLPVKLRRLMFACDAAVMPLRCAFCGARTQGHEAAICDGCHDDLPWIPAVTLSGVAPLEYEIAPLAYAFPVDAAIRALKFRRRLFYGPALGQLLCAAGADLPPDVDAVLPVPLHWRRQWLRGFNQATEIALPVARQLGVPLVSHVRRRRPTRPQSGLSGRERASNLAGAFAARGTVAHEHVLIIDDVITTGATMQRVARSLLRAGAAKVSGLAVARACPWSP